MRSVGLVLAGFLAVIGVGYGAVHGLTPVVAQSLPAAAPPPVSALPQVPENAMQMQLSFAPVVRAAAPGVVSIYARRLVADRPHPFFDDPLFGPLFGQGRGEPRIQNALGSGVLLTAEGIVVSNFHVVGGADDIRVVLGDRREFAADLVLQDEESDLAILRLRGARDLPVMTLADSDAVEVGDLVLAIGNPFGVGQTVSSGIVSALARSGMGPGAGGGYFIQTDAAINPGNSGGALVDMAGRLVGINTAILTRSGGSNGIGFAIPANLVAQVVAQAEAGQTRFVRPWVGVTAQAVDATLAEAFGQGLPQGVVITDLHPQSPLRAAGLRTGDLVLMVAGAPVNSEPELLFRLAARGIGGTVTLAYRRGRDAYEVNVRLMAPPETPDRARLEVRGLALRGLVAETINPAVIAEHGLEQGAAGVLVVGVQDIAARAGLLLGDRLLALNRAPLADTSDLERALRSESRYWEVEILRDGRRNWLRFRL